MERSPEHNQKIGEAQRRSWASGKRERAPLGAVRFHNGKHQVRVLSKKGWRFWKNVAPRFPDYSKLPASELPQLSRRVRDRLKRQGLQFSSPPRRRGYRPTPEHREKISRALRRYLFDVHALDRAAKQRLRKSLSYATWRENVFARDNWTCQKCAARGIILEAHHIRSFSKFPELRFELTNGITLCQPCHRKQTFPDKRHVAFRKQAVLRG